MPKKSRRKYFSWGDCSGGDGNDLDNYVENQCLHIVVDALASSDIEGRMGSIISGLDKNANVSVKFYDGLSTSTGTAANTTPAAYDPNTGHFSVNITLSTDLLLGTSREYLATVVIHEVIHAYFAYQSKAIPTANSHSIMASDYIAPMAEFISSFYGIDLKDATALAWIGVNDTPAFQNATSFGYGAGQSMSKSELMGIYTDYLIANKGHQIPANCE